MNKTDARILFCGLIPEGFEVECLTARGRQEVRDAIDKILELTGDDNAKPIRTSRKS